MLLQSPAQLRALLAGIELTEIDVSEDFEVESTVVLAGEQILLAFIDDRLIYVETFPLISGEAEVVD